MLACIPTSFGFGNLRNADLRNRGYYIHPVGFVGAKHQRFVGFVGFVGYRQNFCEKSLFARIERTAYKTCIQIAGC